ncbi:similar to Saccharomyces cerevisiae YHR195W NVJ1 Nuclear envelope protein [Maudiozyma saulgeensis]|uniref:Similar to Saccharomyces cerevisiae YHR195W NVJ1 Nuclear envelope protein n=1 Tax=Maudiozyma saulgeensis TaxID=1789683 RepID=A0A1X7R0Z2_9SACH|nr:similar to Saccharomyces cerevisiae YHR195W NVJ1 Nuclear envelope protein [Kazachstania saulgeensis]
MARPVLQTTGSLGVSYIIFRGVKQLLSKHVPEKWLRVEEQQRNRVNGLAQRVGEKLQDSLPNIPEDTRNKNILLKTVYDSFQKIKLYEVAIYLLTILVVVILPPLLSLHMEKKKKAALEEFEKRTQQNNDNNNDDDNTNVSNIHEEDPEEEDPEEEDPEEGDPEEGEEEEEEDVSEAENKLSNISMNDNAPLSLIKDELPLADDIPKEQEIADVDNVEEELSHMDENDNDFSQSNITLSSYHIIPDNVNNGEYKGGKNLESEVAERTHDEIDLETGFDEIDQIGSPLEPEHNEVFKENIETVEEPQDVQEKEVLEPEQGIVLEKSVKQPRETPSLSNPKALSFDSQSSLHTQMLFPSAGTSSYIQFSPTKASDLKVEINKKNAYSQPFEY